MFTNRFGVHKIGQFIHLAQLLAGVVLMGASVQAVAAPQAIDKSLAIQINNEDQADQRGLGVVELLYTSDKFDLFLPRQRANRQPILIVHKVADDEPLVELTPSSSREFLYYTKDYAQKIIDIIFENSNLPPSAFSRFELLHYVRGFDRAGSAPNNGKRPLLYGIVDLDWKQPGKLFGNPNIVTGMDGAFLTVAEARANDQREQEYHERSRRSREQQQQEFERRQAEADAKRRQRAALAEKARHGAAIVSATPPSEDNIADAYINEALAFGVEFDGDRTLSAKGTDASLTIAEVTIKHCSASTRVSYRCAYTMVQKRHLDAGSRVFAKTFGIKLPEEIRLAKEHEFVLTAAGWHSPTLGEEMLNRKRKYNKEWAERIERNSRENQQRWQEEALDLLM